VEFYGRVQALLRPGHTVLDCGAGRGSFSENPRSWRRTITESRGSGRTVFGVDPDPVVAQNKSVDTAIVTTEMNLIALTDESIDLIVAN